MDANLKNFINLSKQCFQTRRFYLNNGAAEKLVEIWTLILMHSERNSQTLSPASSFEGQR